MTEKPKIKRNRPDQERHTLDLKALKLLNDTTLPKDIQKSLKSLKKALKKEKNFNEGIATASAYEILLFFSPYMLFLIRYVELKGLKSRAAVMVLLTLLLLSLEKPKGVSSFYLHGFVSLNNYRHTQLVLGQLYKCGIVDR